MDIGLQMMLLLSLLIALALIFWQLSRIKRQQKVFTSIVDAQNRDLASLSIASVTSDERLLLLEQRIQSLEIRIGEIEAMNVTAQPYHGVIQQVRSGVSAEQLVKKFGISREEATLLIRLHGNKGRE